MAVRHGDRDHGAAGDSTAPTSSTAPIGAIISRSARAFSQVAGKVFRIGHLGDLNELMLLGAIAGAEMAMRDVGIDVALGSGVAAAQNSFRGAAEAKEKKVAAE